ncbi:MAG TPA: universal stress protein [Thermoanaerobaculia bacterium]|nr:universal stress protein [Thermoanaerobaculia bacterium]
MDSIRPKLILVPTDFSEPAAHALRFASRLAERVGARIRLMYADYFVPPVDFSASAAVEYALTSDEAADEAKKQLIRLAEEYLPKSVAYETRVVIDSPVPAIVDEARNCGADLVVMGTHGRTGFRRLIVGSVTESVMRMVNVPILAISPLTDERRLAEPFSRVVCAVDDSPESREALRLSATLADAPLAKIVVARCFDAETPQETADEIVRLQAWTPADIVDRCQYKLLPADHPSEQVVELARLVHADLIAAGCVSNRTTSEVMRGTMAERIVERSDCPVLVVNEIAVLRSAAKAELATA